MLPFIGVNDKRFMEIPYRQLIDYKTGDTYPNEGSMDTMFYWKPLSEMLEEYMKHPESKSNGSIGLLERKHIIIDESSIRYIGKESNGLDEKEIMGVDPNSYTVYNNVNGVIQNLNEKAAMELGMSRRSFYYLKKNVKEDKQLTLNKKTMERFKALGTL